MNFEIVRTDDGWHARLTDSTGEAVWSTVNYPDKRTAIEAVDLLQLAASVVRGQVAESFVVNVNETTSIT